MHPVPSIHDETNAINYTKRRGRINDKQLKKKNHHLGNEAASDCILLDAALFNRCGLVAF